MVMKVIGQALEKYSSLTWDTTTVFEDSLSFLSGRMEALVACPKKSGKDKFETLNDALTGTNDKEDMNMLHRKVVYPYDYIDHVDRFTERKIEPIEKFFRACTTSIAARQIPSTPTICGKHSVVKRCVTITICVSKRRAAARWRVRVVSHSHAAIFGASSSTLCQRPTTLMGLHDQNDEL
jgi:hypothetical protein